MAKYQDFFTPPKPLVEDINRLPDTARVPSLETMTVGQLKEFIRVNSTTTSDIEDKGIIRRMLANGAVGRDHLDLPSATTPRVFGPATLTPDPDEVFIYKANSTPTLLHWLLKRDDAVGAYVYLGGPPLMDVTAGPGSLSAAVWTTFKTLTLPRPGVYDLTIQAGVQLTGGSTSLCGFRIVDAIGGVLGPSADANVYSSAPLQNVYVTRRITVTLPHGVTLNLQAITTGSAVQVTNYGVIAAPVQVG